MCDVCKKDLSIIEATIIDKNAIRTFCPNCLLISVINEKLELENNENYYCFITGKKGAVIYRTNDEEYILDKEIMMRLIKRNLKPSEYFCLVDLVGPDNYMIHDDFYTEDGIAIQPVE